MPQMAPLYWSILFLLFLCLYMIYNMILYWMIDKNMNIMKKKTNLIKINWKW